MPQVSWSHLPRSQSTLLTPYHSFPPSSFSPKRRITVEEALQHPYLEVRSPLHSFSRHPPLPDLCLCLAPFLQPYHDPQDEPSAVPLLPAFFDFDNGSDQLSREDLKRSFILCLAHARLQSPLLTIFFRPLGSAEMIYQEIMSPMAHDQPQQ